MPALVILSIAHSQAFTGYLFFRNETKQLVEMLGEVKGIVNVTGVKLVEG